MSDLYDDDPATWCVEKVATHPDGPDPGWRCFFNERLDLEYLVYSSETESLDMRFCDETRSDEHWSLDLRTLRWSSHEMQEDIPKYYGW